MSAVTRQFPNPVELLELMQFKRPDFNGRRRRLNAALTIADLRDIAKRRTPAAAFDYTDGAADSEEGLARARQAFADVEFRPSILRDVSHVDTSCEIFGGPSALPFGIAPTGFTRLMQTEGEIAAPAPRGRPASRSRSRPWHELDRIGPAGQSERAQLVPAVRDEAARDLLRARRARGRRGLRHAVLHRRHPGRRRSPARQAQRLLDPAPAQRRRSSTPCRVRGGGGTSSPRPSSSSPRSAPPAARWANC